MAGYVNSWTQAITATDVPCITETNATPLSSCILWLVVGLVIGSLTFEKKRRDA